VFWQQSPSTRNSKIKNYYEERVAGKIIHAEQVINYNQEAFRQLAIAGVPVSVVRAESYGVVNPCGFVLVVEGAHSAELRPDGDGCIFSTSGRREKQIQQMAQEVEKLTRTNRAKLKRLGSERQRQ